MAGNSPCSTRRNLVIFQIKGNARVDHVGIGDLGDRFAVDSGGYGLEDVIRIWHANIDDIDGMRPGIVVKGDSVINGNGTVCVDGDNGSFFWHLETVVLREHRADTASQKRKDQ
ncbi:hypothetical protein SDC9_55817 [bioreactor metagenome]|uniref:Uncharacterized protein n=1 Tax=bioreactor metagenome TaxID=1076179 RepID=A0A644X088_9ZZZZ